MTDTSYYTQMSSPLGKLSLRASARGLTGIYMEDHRHAPADIETAAGTSCADHLDEARRQLAEYFAGTRTTFDLVLDHEADGGGTAFQRRVWAALSDIRYGETISYGELARRIGQPAAVRAVGRPTGATRGPSSSPVTG